MISPISSSRMIVLSAHVVGVRSAAIRPSRGCSRRPAAAASPRRSRPRLSLIPAGPTPARGVVAADKSGRAAFRRCLLPGPITSIEFVIAHRRTQRVDANLVLLAWPWPEALVSPGKPRQTSSLQFDACCSCVGRESVGESLGRLAGRLLFFEPTHLMGVKAQ